MPAPVCLVRSSWSGVFTGKGIFSYFLAWIGAGAALALQENGGVPGQAPARSRRSSGWKCAPLTLNGPGPRIPTTPPASAKAQLT